VAIEGKGFYFSFDALVAAMLIFFAFFAVMNMNTPDKTSSISQTYQRADTAAEDSIQLGIQSSFRRTVDEEEEQLLIENTSLDDEDLDGSVLDVIATLWASNETGEARDAAERFFSDSIPDDFEYRVTVQDEETTLIYNSSDTFENSSLVARSTRMVSGVSKDRASRGFTAQASLTDIGAVKSDYFYFGGYVGDGDITANITLPEYQNIVATEIEGSIGGAFNLSINSDDAGQYQPSAANLSANTFTVCNQTYETGRCSSFTEGSNTVGLDFINGTSIGGGFIRVDYNRSESLESQSGQYQVREEPFPGVEGIINIFSSFYVPGTLQGVSARLHYETNNTVFLQLGNTTVYRNTTSGETDIRLDNATIAGELHDDGQVLSTFTNRTVPLRLGVENISEVSREEVDAVSVIDVSGSMDDDSDGDGVTLMDEAKNASKTFTDIILNTSGNRAGMTAYESEVDAVHDLSRDGGSVKNAIDALELGGNTCIGCGILQAIDVALEPEYVRVIPRQSEWRWNASFPETSPPERDGMNWTEAGYNDSDWGLNQTIAGLGDVHTTLPDSGGDYYFRKTFEWDWLDYKDFKAFVRSDDAAEVYINGVLVDNDTGDHKGRYWNRYLNALNTNASDSFERDGLGDNWTVVDGTEGDEVKTDIDCGATDGGQSLIIRWGGAEVESEVYDLSDEESMRLVYDMKQGGSGGCETPESGEDVQVEYLDDSGSWNTVQTHEGGGTDPSSGNWQEYTHDLPTDALHDGFQLRFRYPSGSGDDYDYWAVDNFRLGESIPVDDSVLNNGTNVVAVRLKDDNTTASSSWVTDTTDEWEEGSFTDTTVEEGELMLQGREELFYDGFEDGGLSPWSCTGDGSCDVTADCATAGSYAAEHSGGEGSVVSPTEPLDSEASVNVSYWVRKGGSCSTPPEDGEDLAVEYLDSGGSWNQIELIEASSLSDGEVVEHERSLPTDAMHADFQLRFRQTNDGGGPAWQEDGRWHMDEVQFRSVEVTETEGSYTSKLFDAGQSVPWQDAVIEASTPDSTSYSIDYSDGDQWYDTIDDVPTSRSLRFNITMTTGDTSSTPVVDEVNITYEGKTVGFDFGFNASTTRNQTMVVMSDGEANRETSMEDVPDHDDDDDVDAKDHTIEAGCRAYEDHGIYVFAVGFGSGADNQTLNMTADCGGGSYFFASTGELEEIFSQISESILEASERGQQFLIEQGTADDALLPDSVLRLNYSSPGGLDFGRFRISQESERFGGNVSSPKNGSFDVPAETELVDARLLSYSANYWTDRVMMHNTSGQYESVFNLTTYGSEYSDIGDPYNVHLPPSKATVGAQNNVSVDTALNPNTTVGGSNFSRVVYDLLVDGFVGYGDVFEKSEGGTRTVTTDYGAFDLEVGNASDPWEPNSDAADNATERLLAKLDVDDDGSVDYQIDSDNLNIDKKSISGLKWLWGPALVSVEVWEE